MDGLGGGGGGRGSRSGSERAGSHQDGFGGGSCGRIIGDIITQHDTALHGSME